MTKAMAKARDKEERWYYSFLPFNMSGGGTNALIPLFVTEGLKGTVAQVGIVSAATSLASVPGAVFWGTLSDTTKRRVPFVLVGFLGVALSLVLMGLSQGMTEYYLANFLFGFMGAAIAPVGTVMVLECFKREQWAKRLGEFSRVGGLGWVIGLLMGTIWLMLIPEEAEVIPMRALFLLSGGLSFISVLLGWHYMREPTRRITRQELSHMELSKTPVFIMEKMRYMPNRLLHVIEISGKNLRPVNFPSNLKRYYVVVLLAFIGFLSFYVALPVFLRDYVGISSAEVFMVYLASSAVSLVFYAFTSKLVDRFGGRRVQAFAFGFRMLVIPTFFLITMFSLNLTVLFILMCLLNGLSGMCWALLAVAGDALVAKMAYPSFRSQSMGMYNSVRGISSIIGSLTGGMVAAYFGYLPLFIMSSIFILSGLVLLFFTDVEKETTDDILADVS